MALLDALKALIADAEALPENKDFDLLVSAARAQLAQGKSLASVVIALANNQQIDEHLAMLIVAAAQSLIKSTTG